LRLVIITKAGVPVERDVILETVRRARERGAHAECVEHAVDGLNELESELDAYAQRLVSAPEYGEVAVEAE